MIALHVRPLVQGMQRAVRLIQRAGAAVAEALPVLLDSRPLTLPPPPRRLIQIGNGVPT